MSSRTPYPSHRSFRWGVVPQFSRSPLLAPPTARAPHGSRPWEPRSVRFLRRERPRLAIAIVVSVFVHAAVLLVWHGRTASAGWGAERSLRTSEGIRLVYVRPLREIPPAQEADTERRDGPGAPENLPAAPKGPPPSPLPSRQDPTLRFKPKLRPAVEPRPGLNLNRVDVGVTWPVMQVAGRRADRGATDAEEDGVADRSEGLQPRNRMIGVARVRVYQTGAPAPTAVGAEDGSSYVPARARSILRAWQPPVRMLGREVLVRVRIDADGNPTGPVELLPGTLDRATRQELIYRSRHLTYWPALRNGEPVEAWAEISYAFCYDGVTASSPPSPTFGRSDPCDRNAAPTEAGSSAGSP